MRPAVIVVMLLAALMALATGLLMSSYLTPPPPVALTQSVMLPPKPRTVSVLVAGSSLEVGRTLTADNFEWQEWPDGAVRREQGVAVALSEDEKPEMIKHYEGTVLRSAMIRNEPFSDDKVIRPAAGGLLALVLSPGMRSSTVPINAISGAGGMVQPGDKVDLLLTMDLPDPGAGEVSVSTRIARPRVMTETILKNLKVIARDRSFSPNTAPDSPVPNNVTFEVTPQQAETIATAARMGIFSLVMRPLRTGDDLDRIGIPVTTDVQAVPGLQASRRNIPLSEIDMSDNPFTRPLAEAPRQSLTALPPAMSGPPPGFGSITINRWTAQQVIPTMHGKIVEGGGSGGGGSTTVLPPASPLPPVGPILPLKVPGQSPPTPPPAADGVSSERGPGGQGTPGRMPSTDNPSNSGR